MSVCYHVLIPETHGNETKNQISIRTEAKLALNPEQKLVTVRKTTAAYVDENWLKMLKASEVIEGYKITRQDDKTTVELTFLVDNG